MNGVMRGRRNKRYAKELRRVMRLKGHKKLAYFFQGVTPATAVSPRHAVAGVKRKEKEARRRTHQRRKAALAKRVATVERHAS